MNDRELITFYNPQVLLDDQGEPIHERVTMGHEAWTVVPYIRLRATGFPCRITRTLPDEGIVIAHWDYLPHSLRPTRKRYLISTRADRRTHLAASAEIVQNPSQARYRLLQPNFYMQHFPLEDMRPRDPSRPFQVKNVVYTGNTENLAPELYSDEMRRWFADQGFHFRANIQRDDWGAFEDADVFVSIRDFKGNPWSTKPLTKLINGWQAGVPALLGPEISYIEAGRHGEDCFIIRSLDDIKHTLLRLRSEEGLWQRIVDNGRRRLEGEYTFEHTTQKWVELLENEIIPRSKQWFRNPMWATAVAARGALRRNVVKGQTTIKQVREAFARRRNEATLSDPQGDG